MTKIAVILIVLAIVVGVVGLIVDALQWLLLIAAVLLVLGLVRAFAGRISGRTGARDV